MTADYRRTTVRPHRTWLHLLVGDAAARRHGDPAGLVELAVQAALEVAQAHRAALGGGHVRGGEHAVADLAARQLVARGERAEAALDLRLALGLARQHALPQP